MSVTEPNALQLQLIRLEFKVDAIAGQYAFDSRTNRGQNLGCPILEKTNIQMKFCFQNCSDLLREKIVMGIEKNFKVEGHEFANMTRTIYWDREISEQFLKQNLF